MWGLNESMENPNAGNLNGVPYGLHGMEVEEIGMDSLNSGATVSAASTRGTKDGKTTTYAAMVAKPHSKDSCSKQVLNFTNEDVVVLDEGCLVDESSAFSGGVGLRLEGDGSLTERYGLWMVAANRRRCYAPPSSAGMDSVAATGFMSGSRFATLTTVEDVAGSEQIMEARPDARGTIEQADTGVEAGSISRGKQVVQDNGIKFNKAYMASNPIWQPKVGKGGPNAFGCLFAISSSGHKLLLGVVDMIDYEARRMQHGLDRDYEVMDDNDPYGCNFEVEIIEQSILICDEVVEVVPRIMSSCCVPNIEAKVVDMVDESETWKFAEFGQLLPMDLRL
ncbi:hypothetical protein V6N12_044112 [Hibiscus sabdariffa]|uniref:Uncharacterized protein n=1 Tax=Hibiscus sabdariffa TaxID=183260 RepID=A0ABR2DGB0_9ROSI